MCSCRPCDRVSSSSEQGHIVGQPKDYGPIGKAAHGWRQRDGAQLQLDNDTKPVLKY